jgi:hypothetical protein
LGLGILRHFRESNLKATEISRNYFKSWTNCESKIPQPEDASQENAQFIQICNISLAP